MCDYYLEQLIALSIAYASNQLCVDVVRAIPCGNKFCYYSVVRWASCSNVMRHDVAPNNRVMSICTFTFASSGVGRFSYGFLLCMAAMWLELVVEVCIYICLLHHIHMVNKINKTGVY